MVSRGEEAFKNVFGCLDNENLFFDDAVEWVCADQLPTFASELIESFFDFGVIGWIIQPNPSCVWRGKVLFEYSINQTWVWKVVIDEASS